MTSVEPQHYAFPKIRQYHQVLRDLKLRYCYTGRDEAGDPVYDMTRELPIVTFRGTVKLHGTNAAIVFRSDGSFYCQSRENIITPESDNAGFARWVHETGHRLRDNLPPGLLGVEGGSLVVYGEWCGGSIQKGVAINQLPKMFVVFGLRLVYDDDRAGEWLDPSGVRNYEICVHNSEDPVVYKINVDLNRPEQSIEHLTKWVDQIDAKCPFAERLGVEGHGEGIVFRLEGQHGYDTAFKAKGESHTKSKIRKLPTVDVERVNSIHEAVGIHCHEDRLEQGWSVIVKSQEDLHPQKIADFIRWVINDLWTEEGDALEASGISRKEIGAAASKKAARWFQHKLATTV